MALFPENDKRAPGNFSDGFAPKPANSLLENSGIENCEEFWSEARRDEGVGEHQRLKSNKASVQKARSPSGSSISRPQGRWLSWFELESDFSFSSFSTGC
jgi:hypothetical protein